MARLRAVVMIQPRRAGRHTFSGPALDGHGERVLHGVLGEVDVAERPDEHGHRAPVLGTEDARDVRAGDPHRPTVTAQWSVGTWPGSPRSTKGRTSTGRPVTPAIRSAQPSTTS